MTKRKTRSKKKTRRAAESTPMPGWVWGIFGLTIGLSVAAAIYVKDREAQPVRATTTRSEPVTTAATTKPEQNIAEKTEPRFKFYDMLPNFEVIIPEEDTAVHNDSQLAPLDIPGIYVLQAGSFSSYADADRMKARLAMLGISSRIQNVSIDDKAYHRVRIGPVDSLDQLNDLRGQLRSAAVDIMVIRVGG
ncbi:MAG: SPOR domain-containing protein [Gammaproteobacteria bacterium]|nr:SPOR domain-containing protein [Gammaproteobacteria bacterium]